MSEIMTPNSDNVDTRLVLIDQLKDFLVSAPDEQSEAIKQHHLPSGECISCVKWLDKFYISGTDIVRCLTFRFQAFGRPVANQKKFEEGVFSDLRNLKPGTDAILEEPKSAFLDLLFKNNCIRTQKKQKVFHWYSVPHDRLFLDALERDLKREKMGVEPTSKAVAHPAVSINLDTTQAMFDEFRKSVLCELNLDTIYKQQPSTESSSAVSDTSSALSSMAISSREGDLHKASSTIFGQFSLFEGSPTYKQRRRRVTQHEQTALDDDNAARPRRRSTESALATLSATSSGRGTAASRKQAAAQEETNSSYHDHHHSAVRHFECPLPSCGKIFKRLEHMKRHLRTHTLERPYLCDLCGKRFSRSDNLAQHKKTHKRNKSIQRQLQLQQQYEQQTYCPDEDMEDEEAQDEEDDDDSAEDDDDDDDDDDYVDKRVRTKTDYGANGGGRLSGPARRRINYAKSDTKPYSLSVAVNQSSLLVSRTASANRGRVTTRTRNRRHGNSSRTRTARRQAYYGHGSALETQVIYDTEDWPAQFEDIECVKSTILSPTLCQQQTQQQQQQQQQIQQLVIRPTLSNSTSSANSSCHSSPIVFENNMCAPTIKLEDVDLFYDLSSYPQRAQQQQQEQLALVDEEFLPSIMAADRKEIMEDEQYPQEWQQRIDWQQYSLPTSPTMYNYTAEDLIYDQVQAHSDMYLHPVSHTQHNPSAYAYAPSNASSCLASPMPAFLMTPTTHSAATTVVNSPIMEEDYYHPYYSDESPTMTPTDCLLQY